MARKPATPIFAIIVLAATIQPTTTQAFLVDFEQFPPGTMLAPGDLGNGITLSVTNNETTHPHAAIVFDSNCSQGNLPPCTGGDSDLRTPGAGLGNSVAQGNLMIIAENLADHPQCPFQSMCSEGIRSMVMIYNGPETDVTIEVSTKKNPGSGDLGIFAGLNPGDAYEITSDTIGKDKVGSVTRFEIKTAGGALIESGQFHTSCSQPIWSGMPVGSRQELVCFDSKDIVGDESCALSLNGGIVCQDGSSPASPDGLVDEPDDEAAGGIITLTFANPVKCSSLRAIDIETTEVGDRLELLLAGGGTQVVPFALLGDNTAQTVMVPNPAPIDELQIILVGSGGIDDITCTASCGDGALDPNEDCDDGNTLNGDCCTSSCTFANAGSTCTDGNPCTANDQCNGFGACLGGGSSCGDGVLDDACGEQCDDGNIANGDCCNSQCQFESQGSSCVDDGNVCTDDLCDAAGSCLHPDNAVTCDDGDVCTTGDTCGAGTCLGTAPLDCNDGNICTDDSCSPGSGCEHINNSSSCDDGNACTTSDTCSSGVCLGTGQLPCDDGNICTDDSCDPFFGCTYTDNSSPCDDSNECSTSDTCSGGVCIGGPAPDCDDSNVCTDDSCNSSSGCEHLPNTATCSNGNPLDNPDSCIDGTCVGTGGCQGNNANCNDSNPCTDDTCLPSGACDHTSNTTSCDDGDACTTSDTCGGGVCAGGPPVNCDDGNLCTDDSCNPASGCTHTSNTGGCDDGNACTTGDACSGGSCAGGAPLNCDDGNLCTDDSCDPLIGCQHGDNSAPCDDGQFCNGTDACGGGSCSSHSGDPCSGTACNSCQEGLDSCFDPAGTLCNDGNQCSEGEACDGAGTCSNGASVCGNGVTDSTCGEQCDNGNANSDTTPDACRTDCLLPFCGDAVTDSTEECDDGNANSDTTPDACRTDCSLPRCSDGVVDSSEECDDGNTQPGDGCDSNCLIELCGNGQLDPDESCDGSLDQACALAGSCRAAGELGECSCCGDGELNPQEECDDGNSLDGDGCSSLCELEEKVCFPGKNATVSRGAKFVTFESSADFLGTNPDGNQEIFTFNRKDFAKLIRKGTTEQAALAKTMRQITNTTAPVANEWPTLNASGRFAAFVSNASLCTAGSALASECTVDSDCPGGTCSDNPDANNEVFHMDVKRGKLTQISTSALVDNLHPNLRAFKGNLLMFDSPANLVSDRCAGGSADRQLCQSDIDCSGGTCGNLEGNREVFEWVRARRNSEVPLRQITTAPSGESVVGRSLNFHTRATAFSSTADLLGTNPDQSREIFRVRKKAATLLPVTEQVTTSPDPPVISESPSQSKRRIVAFVSDGDLVSGENSDRNPEIFLWRELATGGVEYTQVTHTVSCESAFPSISSRGRFLTFQSTCDLLPTKGNPDQSVFIYDLVRGGFLNQVVLRGPNGAASARPTVSRRVRVITFEADVGPHNVVCVYNARREVLEGPISP